MKWTLGIRMGFYRFALPVPGDWSAEGPGRWEILLDWKGNAQRTWDKVSRTRALVPGVSRKAVRYDALVQARSDLEMAATVGQDRLTPGARVTVQVRLSQYGSIPVDSAKVSARVRLPNGAASLLALALRGDGVYETEFAASTAGVYTIRISAEGRTLRGFAFTREAVRTAVTWQGGDAPPPTKHDDGWCSVVRCLLECKVIDPEVLKRWGIDPNRLLLCCHDEERIEGKPR